LVGKAPSENIFVLFGPLNVFYLPLLPKFILHHQNESGTETGGTQAKKHKINGFSKGDQKEG
jgi:hypothetical protein